MSQFVFKSSVSVESQDIQDYIRWRDTWKVRKELPENIGSDIPFVLNGMETYWTNTTLHGTNTTLPVDFFAPIAHLLTTLSISNCNLPPQIFSGLPRLHTLRIGFSEWQESETAFQPMATLKEIQFICVPFKDGKIPENFFASCPFLERVHFEMCKITHLPPNCFQHNPLLKTVNLSRNLIKEIPDSLFEACPLLEGIYIPYNSLTTLPPLFHHNPKLSYAQFYNNPLQSVDAFLFCKNPRLYNVSIPTKHFTGELPDTLFGENEAPQALFIDATDNYPTDCLWKRPAFQEYKEKCQRRRATMRCHAVKEELMATVWNPERPFTQWALLQEMEEV